MNTLTYTHIHTDRCVLQTSKKLIMFLTHAQVVDIARKHLQFHTKVYFVFCFCRMCNCVKKKRRKRKTLCALVIVAYNVVTY